MDAKAAQFHKQLVQALKSNNLESFDFAEFTRKAEVSPEVARDVAEKLFFRLCTQATADGVVTVTERKRIEKAAQTLQIETERAESILLHSNFGGSEINLPQADADDEQQSVEQIQISLGIRTDDSGSTRMSSRSPQPRNADSVPFSKDESRFKKTLRYTNTAPVETVLSDMNFLRYFDREHEGVLRFWRRIIAFGVVGIVIGVICLLMEFTIPGIGLIAAGAVTLVTGMIFKWSNSNFDLENRRYEVVSGLLRLLSKDMATDEAVTIEINFQPHNHKSNLVRTGKVGYWDAKFFVHKWLGLRGRFLDGTKFSITVLEKQQDRHRKKRSASGKTKHKYKTKNASEAIVSLKIKQKRYPQSADLKQKIRKSVQLPDWADLKSIDAEGDSVTIRSATKLPWDASGPNQKPEKNDGVNWLALMFLSLYNSLNVSK